MAKGLSILNPHPTKLPGPELLHDLIATSPSSNSVAIEFCTSRGDIEHLSYNELHQNTTRLSKKLAKERRISSSGSFVVPIYIHQCPNLYLAQIAVLKAGGAFCPISLDVPEERLKFILRDVEATVLVTTAELRDQLPALENVSVVSVDDLLTEESEDEDFNPSIEPSQPAYIMYTSGSTGLPKGVVLSHTAATQALLAHDRHIPEFSRFLQFASPTFDVSVFEIFFPLLRGSTIVSCDRRQLLTDLPGCIRRLRIDAAELTPSVASSLLQGRSSVPTLKTLLTIGEMLKHDVVEDFGGYSQQQSILHGMYGPTEATIHCTLQTSFESHMAVGNIGVPLDTVSCFVVKALGESESPKDSVEIVPVGDEGELAVGGFQLADGYLNRDEQTKKAFVSHPDHGRLYRTGDRARITQDGTLECLGRISSGQVKLRGQRIELGEIEHAASRTEGCRSVVAEVVGSTLVTFCVRDNNSVSAKEIRECCRKWLPTFMVPGDIILLDSLPYLASGKVDRKALHTLYVDQQADSQQDSGEVSVLLGQIMDCLSEVLQAKIEPNTELVSVGLDSLSSIRLASNLRKQGLPNIDATALLEADTARDIELAFDDIVEIHTGEVVSSDFEDTCTRLRKAINRHKSLIPHLNEIEDVFPATPVQSAMIAETSRDPQKYCNWIELWIDGSYSVEYILNSIRNLAQIHCLLRSGFVAADGNDATHAVVVWRTLTKSQLQRVDQFDHDFRLENESDLFYPCHFQILESDRGIRILLQIHHALYDQWSTDVLRSDLQAILEGDMVDERHSFRHVSAHCAEHFRQESTSLEFWQNHLRDYTPTSLPLMVGARLPPAQHRTEWRSLDLNLSSLRCSSKDFGFSSTTYFQAALAWILGCYIGDPDVVYGVVFSGRHIPVTGIDKIFGPCLASLPLRVDSSTARTCLDLVRLVHDQNRQLQRHSLTPLQEIRNAAHAPPGVPLFDTLLVWQESALAEEGNVREVASADHHEFKLVLEFEPINDCIRARSTYQHSTISIDQVNLLMQQVCAVVQHIINEPHDLVENLSSAFKQDGLLSISNHPHSSSINGRSIIDSIQQHAVNSPNMPAVTFARNIDGDEADCETITYAKFNQRANRLARLIRASNWVSNMAVCVCMEKSIDFYAAALGTIKAGANYLPLVPDTPHARIKAILKQADVRVCICDGNSVDMFRDIQNVEVVINICTHSLDAYDSSNLNTRRLGADVFYTIFTSGSTGEPKGVAVTTDNTLANLQVLAELYQVQPADRLLQACSQAFDVSVFEIFFTFYTGMCLCSGTKDVLFRDFEVSIRALNISHLSLTPTVASLVDPRTIPSVRFLVTAGEGITDLVHSRWAGHGLHQGYGPSETTNICTINMNVSPSDLLGNIGRPFRNTSAFVMAADSNLTILPSGSIGELVFGGEQVFQGYLGRDDLNNEKIMVHPQFGRLYKSGDIGRFLPDGSILISGRIDDQVKVRGNRIELGEINATLLHDSAIVDCTTLVIDDEHGGQSLISFIVLADHTEQNSKLDAVTETKPAFLQHLFESLESTLPSYMVPATLVPVNKLPMTSSGKLDKRALKEVFFTLDVASKDTFSRSGEVSNADEDWTTEERLLAVSLAEVLLISESTINKNTSFFSLGLNSLNAIAFAKKATDRLSAPVAVSKILQNPSIARLSRVLASEAASPLANGAPHRTFGFSSASISDIKTTARLDDEDIQSILPCTPLQEAMLSASASSSSSAYCNTTLLNVPGDINRLKECWEVMMSRHGILRTGFVHTMSSSNPYAQVVLKSKELPWHQHTTAESSECNFGTEPNISHSSPFRIEVLSAPSTTKLALHMHHAIYDGISMGLLLDEVERVYQGQSLEPPAPFETFLEHVEAQKSDASHIFWQSYLEGYQPKSWVDRKSTSNWEEATVEETLPLQTTELESFCKRHAISQLAVYQAALFKVLSCCHAADDICIGNVVSGRSVPVKGVDKLVAPCFNTIPIRCNLTRLRSNLQLVQRLQSDNTSMVDYHLTPLRKIQALTNPPTSHLFDCLLIMQPRQEARNQSIWTVENETGDMGLPLVFEVAPHSGELGLALHHILPLVSQDLAHDLATAYCSALQNIVRYPSGDVKFSDKLDHAQIAGRLISKKTSNSNDGTNTDSNSDWSETEVHVRDVFSELAAIDPNLIGKNTSMYQIGLDSLNAAQVAARLATHGLVFDAADIMENLCPSSIAAAATSKSDAIRTENSKLDLNAYDRQYRMHILGRLRLSDEAVEAIRPCTPIQAGMIAQSLSTNGQLYVNHITYRIPNETSTDSINKAWRTVQQKHQALRMGFSKSDDPKLPFTMVIFNPAFAKPPCSLVESSSSLDDIEASSTRAIMKSIDKHPWRVCLQRQKRGVSMTLSMHHALYDAEGLTTLLSDLLKALTSISLGQPRSLDLLLSATLAASMDHSTDTAEFWRDSLQGIGGSKFPDLSPTRVEEGSLESSVHKCSSSLTAIERFCQGSGASIQALGQTIWATLLSAYLGDSNVVFGTILSVKALSSAEDIIFPRITTIPVPCDTTQNWSSVLKSMVNFNASMQRHRFAPLSDIQRWAGNASEALFDTVFVYQKAFGPQNDPPRWQVIKETSAVDYTVSLELESAGSELSLRLTYKTARVPHEHAQLMLRQYDHLLAEMLSSGGKRVSDLDQSLYSVSPPQESHLPSQVQHLHQFVEETARLHPSRPALELIHSTKGKPSVRRVWSYQELNERSNQVAHLIRSHGIAAGSVVALSMEKSPEASFAFVGILKAGCSFLAMDPELPEDRIRFILDDSRSQLVFVDRTTSSTVNSETITVIELSEVALNGYATKNPDCDPVSSDSTCYCLYTSGTTGTPKGCEITHENAVQFILSFHKLFAGHWDDNSRMLQFASYWFDVSVMEQFFSWSIGITLVVAPRDIVLEDLPGFLREINITHIDLTPSLARLLDPNDIPSLWKGVFITGGEALKQEIINAWGPKNVICNGYGPTEATIGVTMNRFIGSDAKPSNIGHQYPNVGAYVLHAESQEPVLRGAVGELCVSGKLVGKGYLNRPDLTAESFPTLSNFGERVYRTGDLVRLLADGSFSFIGRKDTQAKLRGQRLELGEIDTVIRQTSDTIIDAISHVVKSDGGKETLVSFLATGTYTKGHTLKPDASENARCLAQKATEACKRRLPPYMVPTHVIPITFVPLTVNNKVDAKQLTALYNSMPRAELQQVGQLQSSTRPLNDAEAQIAATLGQMLDIDADEIRADSNLFSLGLSSISAISLSGLLKRKGYNNASVATIMTTQTIEALARVLSEPGSDQQSIQQAKLRLKAFSRRHRRSAARRLSIDLSEIEAIVPCLPLQHGIIVESLQSTGDKYFNDFRYELNNVDIDALKRSVEILIRKTETLRTRIIDSEDGFVQVILSQVPTPFFEWSISSKDLWTFLESKKAEWVKHNDEGLLRPFEVHILRSSSSDILLLHIHHAIYDGISLDLMMEKLAKIYACGTAVDCGPSFVRALPYGPFAQPRDGKVFWSSRLKQHRFAHLRVVQDNIEPTETFAIATARLTDTSELEMARKSLGVSHQAVLQASFEAALYNYSPSSLVYGLVVSGRSIELENADRILGPLFNTLVQPLHIHPTMTWTEKVRLCHDLNTAALPYQHTPLWQVRQWCGLNPSVPMFDVLFVFHFKAMSENRHSEQLFEAIETEPNGEYPLACEVELSEDGHMNIRLVASRNVMCAEDLRHMLDGVKVALNAILRERDSTIAQVFPDIPSSAKEINQAEEQAPKVNGIHGFNWTQDAQKCREIVAEVAEVDITEVDEHSSIFGLGLNSIDAVKLASRLRSAGILIPVSQILQAQTIPRILERSHEEDMVKSKVAKDNILQTLEGHLNGPEKTSFSGSLSDVQRVLPASPNQEALVADMLRSDLREYFNHDVLRLDESIDIDQFICAWQTVVDGSPILRTSFVDVLDPQLNVVFAQVVHKPSPITVGRVHANSLDELDHLLDTIRLDVLDNWQACPPLRLNLVSIASDNYLILSLAHAQYDGHSLALLHEDVRQAYTNSYTVRPLYDKVLDETLDTSSIESRQFWADLLSDATIPTFARDRQQADGTVTHRVQKICNVSSEKTLSFCREYGISMQSLCQTSWSLAIASHVQALEVLFGVVLACRDSEEAEQVLFPTMNTVAMRASLHGSRIEMLKHMQSTMADILPYQRTPLRLIQSASAEVVVRDDSDRGSGLFDTIFIYQQRPTNASESRQLYESIYGSSNVDYPVAVEMEVVDESIVMRAACKDNFLDRTGSEALLDQLQQVLEAILEFPEEPTVDLGEEELSICGLPGFQLQTSDFAERQKINPVNESNGSLETNSPTLSTIRETLATVAQISIDEVTPMSTVEAIGIDSISAIKVSSLLRKQGIQLSVSNIIKTRYPMEMAKLAADDTSSATNDTDRSYKSVQQTLQNHGLTDVLADMHIDVGNVESVIPATPGQLYVLQMWQKTAGQLFYPEFVYRLQFDVDAHQIRKAWMAMVSKHAILRTIFCFTDNVDMPLLQTVLKHVDSNFLQNGEIDRQDDFESQPLVWLHADKVREGYLLRLKIHHALYDAVSLPLLLDDLRSLIAGVEAREPKCSLTDFLALSITTEATEARRTFWTRYLGGITSTTRRLNNVLTTRAQKRLDIYHPSLHANYAALEKLARKESLAVQSLLFAAYAKVYSCLATNASASHKRKPSGDIVLGIYLSNRSHLDDLDRLPAPTLNLVPLRVNFPSRHSSILELARQVQKDLQEIGTATNSAVSLAEIAQWTGVELDSFVNFLKLPDSGDDSDDNEDGGRVRLQAVDGESQKNRSRVVDVKEQKEFRLPEQLKGMDTMKGYRHAIDIEMIVRDGHLDVGVFGPEAMLGLEDAEAALREFQRLLEELTR